MTQNHPDPIRPHLRHYTPANGAWPWVRKSARMLELEMEYPGYDIRDILLSLLQSTHTDAEVASLIDISYSGVSSWISRLHIVEEAITARDMRIQPARR